MSDLNTQRTIEVLPYNKTWPRVFQAEKQLLAKIFGDLAVSIEHIGSTSVTGLCAKPIIDIQIEVRNIQAVDDLNHQFEQLGYHAKGENGIKGRRYFQKGGNQRTHHVHVYQSGDENLLRHLAFRDYLINNPDIRDQYAKVKLLAVTQCNQDINQYMAMKNDFIQHHEKLALQRQK